MRKFKTLGRTLILLLVSLVLGVNVYLWNARSLMGNALPMPFGYGAAVVLTGSMEPEIMVDDLIIVAEGDGYELGEVVVYQSGSILVVHRIVEIDGDMVTTKGDANNAPDAPIPSAQIKGRVTAVLPGIGTVVKLLKSPTASVTLIVGALALMEVSYRKEKKKDSDELDKIKEEIRRLKAEQQE